MTSILRKGDYVQGLGGSIHIVRVLESVGQSKVMAQYWCRVKAWFDLEKQDPAIRLPFNETVCDGCICALGMHPFDRPVGALELFGDE